MEEYIVNTQFPINKYTHKELIQYKYETLLYVIESLENSQNHIVKEGILLLKTEEFIFHLEFHQKMLFTYCDLKNLKQFVDYIIWTLRIYNHKEINLDFIKIELETWNLAHKKYLSKIKYEEINSFYSWLIANFQTFKEKSLKPIESASNDLIEKLFTYLINSDLNSAIRLCSPYCQSIEEFNNFFSTKISKTMYKVGYMWELGKINIAQEHISSSIVEELSLHFINKFQKKTIKSPTILLATSPKEIHALGIKVISSSLKKLGFNTINLGANPEENSLLSSIKIFKADYLALSVTLPVNIPIVISMIKKIKSLSLKKRLKIIIGGFAFQEIEDPAVLMGADFYSNNLNEIVQYINKTSREDDAYTT